MGERLHNGAHARNRAEHPAAVDFQFDATGNGKPLRFASFVDVPSQK